MDHESDILSAFTVKTGAPWITRKLELMHTALYVTMAMLGMQGEQWLSNYFYVPVLNSFTSIFHVFYCVDMLGAASCAAHLLQVQSAAVFKLP